MSLEPGAAWHVFERDGWKCRHCKDRNGLHPHHVIYKSHQGADVLTNLLTLCAQCHRATHDGFLAIEVIDLLEDNLNVRFTRLRNWRPT